MTWVIASFVTAVLTLGIYCLVVLPRYGWRKVAAPSVLGLVYGAFLFCSLQALGHPKPAWIEMSGQDEARLVAYSFNEGHAIYLWLQPQDSPEPIAYALPWQEEQAAAIYRASEEAKAAGTPAMVEGVGRRHRGDFKAYATPVQPLAPKT